MKYRVENVAPEDKEWALWEVQVEQDGKWVNAFAEPSKELCDRVAAFLNREEERESASTVGITPSEQPGVATYRYNSKNYTVYSCSAVKEGICPKPSEVHMAMLLAKGMGIPYYVPVDLVAAILEVERGLKTSKHFW